MNRSVVCLLLCACLLAGCGSDDQATTQTTASSPTPTAATPTTTVDTAARTTAAETKPDVAAAVAAVRDELPDIPYWKSAKFKGTVITSDKVCVDRTVTKQSAETLGGGRTSHVVVTFPDLSTGEPQDGPCAKAEQNAARHADAARAFYLRMDDYAIALDQAVSDAQAGAASAADRIGRLRTRIRDRLNDYLLSGGDTSVGANLLLSAATTAREAAQSGDAAELADQRREIAAARTKLAQELKR
jgi:3-oxoacyl-ACP reductase-like protein